jgi:hypothetical protein
MKRRIYKKWLKNPFNKRLIWKICKPINVVPIAVIGKDGKRTKTIYERICVRQKKNHITDTSKL